MEMEGFGGNGRKWGSYIDTVKERGKEGGKRKWEADKFLMLSSHTNLRKMICCIAEFAAAVSTFRCFLAVMISQSYSYNKCVQWYSIMDL